MKIEAMFLMLAACGGAPVDPQSPDLTVVRHDAGEEPDAKSDARKMGDPLPEAAAPDATSEAGPDDASAPLDVAAIDAPPDAVDESQIVGTQAWCLTLKACGRDALFVNAGCPAVNPDPVCVGTGVTYYEEAGNGSVVIYCCPLGADI